MPKKSTPKPGRANATKIPSGRRGYMMVQCPTCRGSGEYHFRKCGLCKGKGQVVAHR